MMLWKKPEGLRYVDLCIYIDKHAPELIAEPRNEEAENLIYNYIWLIVKALAIKKRMFDSFSDYDGYAMYSANRLFFALRKSYLNEGKIIKGKLIKPIKSILNYMKALFYPMKLDYINEQYNTEMRSIFTSKKFDEFTYRQKFAESVWVQQSGQEEFRDFCIEFFQNFQFSVNKVLQKAPFKRDSVEFKKLKISILLNCLKNLKANRGINADPVTATVWKLPKSMGSYVRFFIKELGTEIKQNIMKLYQDSQIDDNIISYMIFNPEGEFISDEE